MIFLMKKVLTVLLTLALLHTSGVFAAATETGEEYSEEQARADSRVMLEDAERARQEAESARAEAVKAAQMARAISRAEAQLARQEVEIEREIARAGREASKQERAELMREERDELARVRVQRQEDIAKVREELSKAHRELREASREVARAHRELNASERHHLTSRHVNLGDRAVIGLVLGNATDEGVEVIGVSPDGPAERAGLQQGDLLVSVQGVELVVAGHSASVSLREVMSNVEDGEDLAVIVQRDGEPQEFTVTAKRREPRGWQSMIRISDVEPVAGVTVSPHVVVERIEIPEIDEEALAAEVEELTERLKSRQFRHVSSDSEGPHNYEIHIEGFSDVGGHAMDEANIWYGLPHAYGLELTRINAGLGSYFKTDHGVLVIRARDGNAYQLESGDVILDIDSTAVDSPGDMMRVLREVEPGSEIEISIKRKRQDKTLTVEVPENRLGSR
jgi:C-terminal processing protease CtpA/Prc